MVTKIKFHFIFRLRIAATYERASHKITIFMKIYELILYLYTFIIFIAKYTLQKYKIIFFNYFYISISFFI